MALAQRLRFSLFVPTIFLAACSGEDPGPADGSGGAISGTGAAAATGGAGPGTGGQSSGGQSSGGQSSGGQSTGGRSTGGGTASGGSASGGAPSSGGAASGGSSSGGATSGGSSGEGEPGDYPKGNAPVPSSACGTPTSITTGERMIQSTNQNRVYYIDVPANYDMNKPYRLFYISHWIGSRYQDMVNNNFYGLKTLAQAAGEPAIFIAPSSDGSTWQEKDHALFDDLLAFAKENLCFDTSRVFATGFSFGGMITYSLSTNHQKDIRAAVGIAPANYNPQESDSPSRAHHRA